MELALAGAVTTIPLAISHFGKKSWIKAQHG